MKFKSQDGRPSEFTEEIAQKIIDSIPGVLSLGLASEIVGMKRKTVRNWVVWGDRDIENGISSPKANFAIAVRQAQASEARIMLEQVREGDKASTGVIWLLKVVFKDDFGEDLNKLASIEKGIEALEAKIASLQDKSHSGL